MIPGIVAGQMRASTAPAEGMQQWRLVVYGTNNTSLVSVPTLELRTAPGGPNVAVGAAGVADASSFYSASTTADKAFDGTTTTMWTTGLLGSNPLPQWLRYTFAAAQSIVEIAITVTSASNALRAPLDFGLQYYDGAAWVEVRRWQTTWPSTGTQVFTV